MQLHLLGWRIPVGPGTRGNEPTNSSAHLLQSRGLCVVPGSARPPARGWVTASKKGLPGHTRQGEECSDITKGGGSLEENENFKR